MSYRYNYIISDPHGNFKLFKKMLEEIEFDENKDHLTILGDVFDRGPESLNLLYYIRKRMKKEYNYCMDLIKGNHELFAELYLTGKASAGRWSVWGGTESIPQVDALNENEKNDLLEFLEKLPLYKEIEYKSKKGNVAVLAHSGVKGSCIVKNEDNTINVTKSIELAYEKDPFALLVSADIHYGAKHLNDALDRFIFVGHVPTMHLNDDNSNKIYKTNNFICIDSGAGHINAGGCMSCFRLDDGMEWYVN